VEIDPNPIAKNQFATHNDDENAVSQIPCMVFWKPRAIAEKNKYYAEEEEYV
jgi:hypothetical protein